MRASDGPGRGTRRPVRRAAGGDAVADLVRRRIETALAGRTRYRYVQPQVRREGAGWAVWSPNCSRNIDPQGGEIGIAWLQPTGDGRWALHARDHAAAGWARQADGLSLDAALAALCADPARRFWP